MSGLAGCIKFINGFIASVFAIVLTYFVIDYRTYQDFSPQVLLMLTIVSYMSDAVSIIGPILDCFESIWENKVTACLKIFISVVLILTLLACAIASVIIIDGSFRTDVKEALENYKINASETRVWDHLQQEFECCGLNNYSDWYGQGDFDNHSLPDSCCFLFTLGCGQGIGPNVNAYLNTDLTIYTRSCNEAGFFEFFYPWTYAIAGVSILMNVLNIVAVIAGREDADGFDVQLS